jgi:hypothetical protein
MSLCDLIKTRNLYYCLLALYFLLLTFPEMMFVLHMNQKECFGSANSTYLHGNLYFYHGQNILLHCYRETEWWCQKKALTFRCLYSWLVCKVSIRGPFPFTRSIFNSWYGPEAGAGAPSVVQHSFSGKEQIFRAPLKAQWSSPSHVCPVGFSAVSSSSLDARGHCDRTLVRA